MHGGTVYTYKVSQNINTMVGISTRDQEFWEGDRKFMNKTAQS